MVSPKRIVRALLPPVIFSIYGMFKRQEVYQGMWTGNYPSWNAAAAQCQGYDDNSILEKCKEALLQVKTGAAVYERDSVVFDKKQYSWPLLAALQKVALEDGRLCVLDFGGSLGSTYFQNKDFINLPDIEWCIVEQPNFVACGQRYFEDRQLRFFETLEQCFEVCQPNVLLLSSVLQYLEQPYSWISKFLSFKFPNIIVDRTSFIDNGSSARLTIQNVPETIYKASYPCWFFNEAEFIKAFAGYNPAADFNSYADADQVSDDGKQLYWKGFYLTPNN